MAGWVALSDTFYDDDAIEEAGPLATLLFVCGIAYAHRAQSGGSVPFRKVAKLADFRNFGEYLTKPSKWGVDPYELAQTLCERGLWRATETGFEIVNYGKYQEPAERQKARSDKARKAARSRWADAPSTKSDAPSIAPSNAQTTEPGDLAMQRAMPQHNTEQVTKSPTHSNLVVVGSEEEGLLRSIQERTGAEAWGAPRERLFALLGRHSFECIEWVMGKAPKDLGPPLLIDWLTTEMAGESWVPTEEQLSEARTLAATFAEDDPAKAKHHQERAERIERIRAGVTVQREAAR